MNPSNFSSIDTLVGALMVILGYWAKSRIESSVKHEYDKALEKSKLESKRIEYLYSERLMVFKLLQKKLVSIRRYCESQISSEKGCEFSPTSGDLEPDDNKSILMHWTELKSLLDENLIFLSGSCRATFDKLDNQLSFGSSMELWLASSGPALEVVASKADCYEAVINRVNECIDGMFNDLGFVSAS